MATHLICLTFFLFSYNLNNTTESDNENPSTHSSDNEENNNSSSDESEEENKPPTQKQMIIFLQTLLSEADSMPVVMEEATVLRCHLSALEWAVKVRPYLISLNVVSAEDAAVVEEGEYFVVFCCFGRWLCLCKRLDERLL